MVLLDCNFVFGLWFIVIRGLENCEIFLARLSHGHKSGGASDVRVLRVRCGLKQITANYDFNCQYEGRVVVYRFSNTDSSTPTGDGQVEVNLHGPDSLSPVPT